MSQNYNLNAMQNPLSRHYKWWFLIMFHLKSRTVSILDSAFFVIGSTLVLIGTLATWWLANNQVIDETMRQRWVYFLAGELFYTIIYNFTEYLGFDFIQGRHVKDLLKPQSYFKLKIVENFSDALAQNLIKITVVVIMILLFSSLKLIDFNILNFLQVLLFAPIAYLILFFVGIMIACFGFYLPRIHGVCMNFVYLYTLLMGRVFPLNLLNSNFWVHIFNPFAYIFYHPMQIYLGKYDNIQTSWTLLGGLAWCIVLYILAKTVFKMGLKRNESVGL